MADFIGDDNANTLSGGVENDLLIGNGNKDSVSGGAGNDILYGDAVGVPSTSDDDDVLNGDAGNDFLSGGGGIDTLNGGEGNDTLVAGYASQAVYDKSAYSFRLGSTAGGDGNDLGTADGDVLDGGAGVDTAYLSFVGASTGVTLDNSDASLTNLARSGATTLASIAGVERLVLFGSVGADTIVGGASIDVLYGNAGADTLSGGLGNDFLVGGDDADTLNGGDGNDTLVAGSVTQADIDSVTANNLRSSAGDVLNGGLGIDTAYLSFVAASAGITLDNSDASLTNLVRSGSTTLASITDIERLVLFGSRYADLITGGAGADTISGGSGNDDLIGGDGDDTLYDNGSEDYAVDNDVLTGGSGDDLLVSGRGNDTLDGGDGNDTAQFERAAIVDLNLQGQAQNVGGTSGFDKLVSIENLIGSQYADTFTGDAQANRLADTRGGNDAFSGGGGNDVLAVSRLTAAAATIVTLDGGEGDDTISFNGRTRFTDQVTMLGGGGNDTISAIGLRGATIDAGSGDDRVTVDTRPGGSYEVTLGAGSDTLALSVASSTAPFSSIAITDFATGQNGDMLDMAALVASRAFTLAPDIATAFLSGHLRLAQVGADTVLEIDSNGGGDAFSALLTFQNTSTAAFTSFNFGGAVIPVEGLGTTGADTLAGTSGSDTLFGLQGDDRLDGGAGDDGLFGGDGADALLGGAGGDLLRGGAGYDQLDGGAGLDTAVFSGNGATYDFVNLGGGRARLAGADGVDHLTGVELAQFDDGVFAVPNRFFDQTPELGARTFGTSAQAGGWVDNGLYPRAVADVNGDGRADLVGFGGAGVFVALADGAGGFGPAYLAKDSFGASSEAGGWSSADAYPRALGDVNGDGQADLIGFGSAGVYASLATGNGQFGDVYLAKNSFGASSEAGGWSSADTYPRQLADINGDGRDDLIGFGSAGVYASLATGNGQFGDVYLAKNSFGYSAEAGGWTNADLYPRQLADINGDGQADLVGFGSAGVYASLATGNGQFGDVYLAKVSFGSSAQAGGWSSAEVYPRALADINGDGMADLVGFGSAGVYVSLATGTGQFGDVVLDLASFGRSDAAGGWIDDDLYPRTLGDINGDGRADIVGFGGDGVFFSYALDLI